MRYSKEDPHFVRATRVQEGYALGKVRLWVYGKDYGEHLPGWSDANLDKTKSDCLIEDPEVGWLRTWWYDSDMEKY